MRGFGTMTRDEEAPLPDPDDEDCMDKCMEQLVGEEDMDEDQATAICNRHCGGD